MTTTTATGSETWAPREDRSGSVSTRLVPLQVSMLAGGMAFWLPIEKLFMTQLGFDAATIGIMAAAYGAAVPLLEIPSGILADRWSRRGVLMLANGAALTSTLIAAISHSVTVYIVSALALGVYLALQSGTVDAMVYDTVLEATGDSDGFERHLGRLRVTSSAALTISALVGGALAAATSPRATYLMTAPFVALSILALLRFDEPVTHRSEAPMSLRQHVSATYRTILQGGPLLPVIAAMVLSGALLQAILEFGPLWLIDLHAPTALYGPVTAGCTASLGLGAVLAARLDFRRPAVLAATIAVAGLTSAVLVAGYSVMAVALALVALTTFLVAASTHLSRLLHDALPSSLRTGVGSGVSTLSWAVFVPGALLMGVITHRHGAHTAGWLIVGGTVSFGALFAWTVRRQVRREGCATQRPTQTPAVVSLPGSPDRRLTAA